MAINPLAGHPVPRELLVDVSRLVTAFFTQHPNPYEASQQVAFGTSGHRGSSLDCSFNEDHVAAISQALCLYRKEKRISGPLFIGKDTHPLSEPAQAVAIEVFAANGVEIRIQDSFGYTPTPVISHAILAYNKDRTQQLADGVVITPSHNPPEDGGFKYNPPTAGPAGPEITGGIQERANQILAQGAASVRRIPFARAIRAETTRFYDYVTPYVMDLGNVVDLESISRSGVRIGVDPMGGAATAYWGVIADTYRLDLTIVNQEIDPTFRFMRVDHDGKIRMDCSSPYAMAGMIDLKGRFDISFGNDPDVDRHGIVAPSSGLMNPNHYLAVAIWYLFQNRPGWPDGAAVGKTLVSSSIIDRVAQGLGRRLAEVPVGFKWFVDGLIDSSFGFAGEESAGASFLRKDGSVWTTDKDGIILGLLSAEITARTHLDPGQHYQSLTRLYGNPVYERIDAPANPAQKSVLKQMTPENVGTTTLAGENILQKLTRAPANNAQIGGLKVVTENGWFAARPSGTEDIYKIYAESFKGGDHLRQIQQEAQAIIKAIFQQAGV